MKKPTKLIHNNAGTGTRRTVNPPIERASTVLFPDRKTLYSATPGYGRMGLGVHRELEAAMCTLEGAAHARLTPNGLSACTVAIGSLVEAGDHVLISDSIYGPTRRFCERRLKTMGIDSDRFSPRNIGDLQSKLRDNTKVIALESPGSLTFEISDTRAIVALAKSRSIRTIMDNTWAAGVFCQPLSLGVDVSVQALTKYVVGHADAFGGAVMTNDPAIYTSLENITEDWGIALAPDDAYAALRGTRTLTTRLREHETTALVLAEWLESQENVTQVIHPALPSHPDHALWQRDFSGSSGLFAFLLNAGSKDSLDAFIDGIKLFKLGFSWGGFESLFIPCDDQLTRLSGDWSRSKDGYLIRLHAGLEDVGDLVADLKGGFDSMASAKTT
ncbi:cystathionine beta-lyase [Henriciella sp. AS95]|uniref:cystathionine beta-lyase n=1 Tax=Henriciella sp. AS95 TaxID=3135782 RepID=UPI00317AE2B3